MQKYFPIIKTPLKNDSDYIDFQIIEWWCQDEADDDAVSDDVSDDVDSKSTEKYVIRCFGVTDENASISCRITGFNPFYYVKVPSDFNKLKLNYLLNYMSSAYSMSKFSEPLAKENGAHKSCIVEKKDLFGFRNGKKYKFVKLVFTNYTAMMRSRYIFKKPVLINGLTTKAVKYKLYESNFEPFMRYCHIKDILMAGWVRLPKKHCEFTQHEATTQIEVTIDRRRITSLKEKQGMAKFLQAAWDIEVYSDDYSFPDPKKKVTLQNGTVKYPNEIFQIATTYKYYGDKDIFVKHLLTLKKCNPINEENVIVEECKNEKELVKKWVDTISQMDPDIFYTYNGDSFDCIYLKERSVILGIEAYVMSRLSRLTSYSAVMKKEFFSSSAYGDNEYNRLYIPGRLNYDLLIHYKRGVKKYPSYKLDYIANEILQEGKHDVSAKEIFKYYEDGNPELIKTIGEYCIQDTELLQKLVDKQLTLTNIVQLANVTYVPIGYLTTKGQTIKVYSQVLRKARQMDFLAPHTNFNEDNFPVQIKTKEAHNLEEDAIGEYIDIRIDGSISKKPNMTCKISEIVDEYNIIVLTDTEITEEYFNKKFKYKYNEYVAQRIWPSEDAVNDTFTGATVLEAHPGMYTDNIAVLDFASLYPTVEISRNLCFSTLVTNEKYLNIPGVKMETIEWDDTVEYKLKQTCDGVGKSGKSKGQICGKQAFFEVAQGDQKKYFCRIHDPMKKERTSDEKYQKKEVKYSYTIVQPQVDENGQIINKGVIPALLEELYAERKKVKVEMTLAQKNGDKLLESIFNSTQLAIKISLNSVYGFLSRNQGNLICKPLGQLTTAIGRMLIEQSKSYAEGEFLEFVSQEKLLTHKVQYSKVDLEEKDKLQFINMFKCNQV
jgi:DNA polymerase elongation subunit (family B)